MSDPSDPIRLSVAAPDSAAKSRPRKLGKGLGALLGETRREEPLVQSNYGAQNNSAKTVTSVGDGLNMLSVSDIEPHPDQPRRHFDETALEELAASIASRGVIQPIIVRPTKGGRYQLVAGERRWRAAQKAHLHQIPALVRDLDERDVMTLALIENIQREDLNPIEEARAYSRLAKSEGLTQAEISGIVDKSRSHVANLQRLLSLPDSVLELVETGELGMGHARALIGNDAAEELARKAVSAKLSVREVEKLVRSGDGPAQRKARSPRDTAKDADIAAVQNHLEEFLGMNVKIATDADPRSGAVSIRYRTLDQLDLLCQRLTGGDI
ncbi:ParB/RepB/Spo0J family partition protein [Altererythrobacter aquiaggeris]|uniref:ParB/RepB/Spo0J family partition protein n=1 Tax=Aestuarierythrobacter aquiaggeris TaxID=1898396 RepID=UPI003017E3A4